MQVTWHAASIPLLISINTEGQIKNTKVDNYNYTANMKALIKFKY
jgi:hypothetical protein